MRDDKWISVLSERSANFLGIDLKRLSGARVLGSAVRMLEEVTRSLENREFGVSKIENCKKFRVKVLGMWNVATLFMISTAQQYRQAQVLLPGPRQDLNIQSLVFRNSSSVKNLELRFWA